MPEINTAVSSSLFYTRQGSGPCIILVHGFPESGSLWHKISEELSAAFTVVIPDMPGSGNSRLDRDTDVADMAACIIAIMDAENIAKAVIAGHSMGGYIGFEFAARYPARLAGLSLVHSIPVADDEEKKKSRQKSIDLLGNGGKVSFIRQLIPNLFSAPFKQSHMQFVEEETDKAMVMNEASLINFTRAMMNRNDNSNALLTASFPVQWIIGKDDNVINFKKIVPYCYKSRINFVSFYNNCGHMSMMEAPDQLSSDLKLFTGYCYENV